MKILVVFLLPVLGCSLAEGVIMSKCEVGDQLVKVMGNNLKALSDNNFVAALVCHAGLVSGFNTSAVKVNSGRLGGHSRDRRNTHESPQPTQPLPSNQPSPTKSGPPMAHTLPTSPTKSGPPATPTSPTKSAPPVAPTSPTSPTKSGPPATPTSPTKSAPPMAHTLPTSPTKSGPPATPTSPTKSAPPVAPTSPTSPTKSGPPAAPTSPTKSSPSVRPTSQPVPKPTDKPRGRRSPQDGDICVLYGIFQLSNCLACSDGTTSSHNICGLDCSKLLDEDISDDISCLMKVIKSEKISIVGKVCEDVQASVYFAGCPSSS